MFSHLAITGPSRSSDARSRAQTGYGHDRGGFSWIGMHGKSEKIMSADSAQRLVIEWTTQLPATRRSAAAR
jgi:hypothetical protein